MLQMTKRQHQWRAPKILDHSMKRGLRFPLSNQVPPPPSNLGPPVIQGSKVPLSTSQYHYRQLPLYGHPLFLYFSEPPAFPKTFPTLLPQWIPDNNKNKQCLPPPPSLPHPPFYRQPPCMGYPLFLKEYLAPPSMISQTSQPSITRVGCGGVERGGIYTMNITYPLKQSKWWHGWGLHLSLINHKNKQRANASNRENFKE